MKSVARCGFTVGALVLAAGLAGFAAPDDRATQRSTDVFKVPPTTVAAPTTTTTAPVDPNCSSSDPTRSLSPIDPAPAPGHMPPGSTMAAIQENGKLRVAVDQNTLLFGYR